MNLYRPELSDDAIRFLIKLELIALGRVEEKDLKPFRKMKGFEECTDKLVISFDGKKYSLTEIGKEMISKLRLNETNNASPGTGHDAGYQNAND